MKRRRPKLWQIAVSIPVVCGLGGWITTALLERSARNDLASELAKLRALGVPTTAAEMVRNVPPERNAASLYQKAILTSQALGTTTVGSFRDMSTSRKEYPEYRAFISKQAPALDLIRKASMLPECAFPRDWSQGTFGQLTELAELKGSARLATARAYLEAEAKNFTQTIDWLLVANRIAAHSREPHVIAVLVSVTIETIAQDEFQQQLSQYGLDPEFRKEAAKFVLNPGSLPSMKEGYKGEVVFIATTMEGLAKDREGFIRAMGGTGLHGPMDYAFRFPWIHVRVGTKMLKLHRVRFEKFSSSTDLMSERDMFRGLDADAVADQSFTGRMVAQMFPGYHDAGASIPRLEAKRRLSRAGLALWNLRAKTGAFPATWDSSKIKILDPFTDKPLIYKPAALGFMLYSVGPNGKDDGGPRVYSTGGRSDDIAFRWAKP